MKQQKVLFVTGAGSGMGQLAARRALAQGWAVAAMDINAAGLEALGMGPGLLKLAVDITDAGAVEAAIARVEAELGPIDRVCNAAAIMPLGLLNDQPGALVHKVMAINYGGLVNLTKAALPRMLGRGRGEFISFASIAGHWPVIYMGAYNASKSAVVAFTEVLYHENRGSGVRFTCVCPPSVSTPLLDQARSTVWPRLFDQFPVMTAERVLDEVEAAIAKGRFWVFPGPLTALVWRLRRWLPDLMWWRVHQVEGR